MRSARSSSAGASGASGRPATRSSRRSNTGRSTITSSGRLHRRTSSSTTGSRPSCSSGRRSGAPRPMRSTSSATRGPAGPPSSAPCSSNARSRTRSPWPTRLRGSAADAELPVVILPDGTKLVNPSDVELTRATGSAVEPEDTEVDLFIAGAGPAGLSAGVYGASEGLRTLVVDTHGIGGQARSSSLIRNYLGFSRGVSGAVLARQAYEQAWVFGARFAFMQHVTGLRADADRLVATLSAGTTVSARAVVLATGVAYRLLGIPALEALAGAGVFYGGAGSDAHRMSGQDVYVVGGATSAGQAALHMARYARRLTLVVRAPSLATGMSHYLVRQLEATPNVEIKVGTEVVGGGGDGWLTHLVLRDRAGGAEETVPADGLYPSIGARPHTEWLPAEIARDERGFVLTGADVPRDAWPLERDPFPLETSMPRVLAVGDARHGSVKRVASAVGAGSIAIRVVHRLLEADDVSAPADELGELRPA